MINRTSLFIGAALVSCSSAAFAQELANYADCQEGGCTCMAAHIDLSDYELATGIPAPAGAAKMTLVAYDGEFYWSESSFEELDMVVGGDGVCTPQLFNIVPEDGTWTGTVEVTGISGCHPQVAQMVRPMVSGMATNQTVIWGGIYDPARLSLGGSNALVQWTRVRSDYFTGTVPMAPQGPLVVSVDTTATLLAPDRAAATVKIRIDAASAADAATLAILGMNGCETNAAYDFRRTGP